MSTSVERITEVSGMSMPLASAIVGLILDSSATRGEVRTALDLVGALLPRLPIRCFSIDEAGECPSCGQRKDAP